MRALLSLPVVGFAFVVDCLRRLPGSRLIGRLTLGVAALLIVAAGVVLVIHFAQKSPQRISMPDLAAGQLSTLQSWIIVSGHMVEDRPSTPGDRLYRLTDDRVPDVDLLVMSATELTVGDTTVSGILQGSRPGPSGGAWTGRLVADSVLATEPPPPWPAVVLALAGVLLILVRRASYPVFFRERPRPSPPFEGRLPVGLRRTTGQPGPRASTPAKLVIERTGAPSLRVPGEDPISLQFHSAITAFEVGVLQALGSLEPAIQIHAPAEDISISFGSRDQRDSAVASLRESRASPRPTRADGSRS